MRWRVGNFYFAVGLFCALLLHLGAAPALAAPAVEPPRALSGQGLENLTAFTRLLGYVRFFHPSDQAAGADWHQVAVAGVQAIERAANPGDLAFRLEEFFRPLAPTLRVYPDGERPGVPGELNPPSANAELVYWSHTGVGLSEASAGYSSGRVSARTAPPADTGLPRPEQPVEVSLGGGVSALLPLTLYRDADGATLPGSDLAPPRPDKPRRWRPTGNDRATRLAGVALTWTVLQHFYPYFDVAPSDWPAELRTALSAAARDRNDRQYVDTLRRLLVPLDDAHAGVTYAPLMRTHQLPLAWDVVEDRWVITWADPRQARGLNRGDEVLAINGRPAGDALADAMAMASASTEATARYRALLLYLVGPRNETVRLRVQRADGRVANVAVRRTVPIPESGYLKDPRPEKVAEIEPGIAYVDLTRINDDDFSAALPLLLEARGIVFDLRGYPYDVSLLPLQHLAGGTLAYPIIQVPRITLPDRPLQRLEQRTYSFPPAAPRVTARAAFLTNATAVSYAETYMGIVEANRLGEIVGGATAGTNGNVNYIDLPGGYSLRFTGMRVLRQNGATVHGTGIPPTIPFSRTVDGIRAGRDEVLERGIEAVR
ncbi:MAG TPA: S41 family peptidase [Thermoanaerobaculia bacterium]|nr:S41 family peptidase [Thermoanaerobaculia bacterium]